MLSDFQLTNRLRKEFDSLDEVKGRRRSGLFVAEGTKCVLELAVAFSPRYVLPALNGLLSTVRCSLMMSVWSAVVRFCESLPALAPRRR